MKLVFPDLTYPAAGGAENMVYEIVKAALLKRKIRSILIGNSDSFVMKRLKEESISFEFVDQNIVEKNTLQFSRKDILINFHNFDDFWKLGEFSGKCIVWGILAPQITGWNRFGIEKKYTGKRRLGDLFTKRLLRRLKDKNSFISMDGATSDALNLFVGVEYDWPIIPIPIDSSDARTPSRRIRVERKSLVLSYVGRSDDVWKLKPAKKIVKDLSKLTDMNFQLNVYTDQAQPYIEELSAELGSNIDVKFHHGIYGPALRSHLNTYSDLHFSMGTAALEGGLAGVPTILVDPCESDIPEAYKYRWLFQTERNSLGRFVNAEETDFAGMEMREVVESCIDEDRRVGLANMNQAYVLQNHSSTVVLEKLLSHPAQATMRDICGFTPATWAIRSYINGILKL
jgi:glycosyltransferase involved in cell wall biosynthesis